MKILLVKTEKKISGGNLLGVSSTVSHCQPFFKPSKIYFFSVMPIDLKKRRLPF